MDQGIKAGDGWKEEGFQVARGRVICNAGFQVEHFVVLATTVWVGSVDPSIV